VYGGGMEEGEWGRWRYERGSRVEERCKRGGVMEEQREKGVGRGERYERGGESVEGSTGILTI
jgi:hypothetical protein